MDIILKKEYISPQNKIYPIGSKLACDNETYERLLANDGCEPKPGDKRKVKTKKKVEENGTDK
jgi:hypothetical protein